MLPSSTRESQIFNQAFKLLDSNKNAGGVVTVSRTVEPAATIPIAMIGISRLRRCFEPDKFSLGVVVGLLFPH